MKQWIRKMEEEAQCLTIELERIGETLRKLWEGE